MLETVGDDVQLLRIHSPSGEVAIEIRLPKVLCTSEYIAYQIAHAARLSH